MSSPPIRVLLVEDDEEDYIIARDLLAAAQNHRFELKWFDRLEPAMLYLSDGEIDVVLLDFSLPDAEGWEALQRMHAQAPHLPIIILTGLADEARSVQAVKEGAQDYLFKSAIDKDQLVRSIRYAIERKRAQETLKRYHDHLEDLVAERTSELALANENLQREVAERKTAEEKLRELVKEMADNNEVKSRFVSNVSHELKTPLASMSSAIENLSTGVVGALPARVRTYVDMLSEDVRRLIGTVNDILDLSRIEADRFALSKVKLPFSRFVRQAVDSVHLQAEGKGLQLSTAIDEGVGFVDCDAQKMERVIFNVIGNCIKYTPVGGTIEVLLKRRDGDPPGVVLDVIDSGIGIEAQYLSRVTERYFRVGEQVAGSGLGLALCKEMLELHGGSIEVMSPPPGRKGGTQVTMCLPAVVSPRVLAVDDDAMVQELLREELTQQGYDVIPCGSAVEAFEIMAREGQPDMLIVDLLMPVLDGVELIAKVKSHHELRQIPTIMITGHEMDETKREILEGFGVPALRKPWRRHELIQCIEEAVMGKQYPMPA